MNILFLGTGEACDTWRKNASVLLEEGGRRHLLDCGFSSASGFFRHESEIPLTSIWISHLHGDHFFGIPQLLTYFYMENRQETLTIISGCDCEKALITVLELAYPGLLEKLPFSLCFLQLKPGKPQTFADLTWQTAPVLHSPSSFCLKITSGQRAVYYSGDGKPTVEAVKLVKGCDLVIHEAFSLTPAKPSHSSIEECLLLARELEIPRLALLHLNRATRKLLEQKENQPQCPPNIRLLFPDDNDKLVI